jgi:hypothetical protein
MKESVLLSTTTSVPVGVIVAAVASNMLKKGRGWGRRGRWAATGAPPRCPSPFAWRGRRWTRAAVAWAQMARRPPRCPCAAGSGRRQSRRQTARVQAGRWRHIVEHAEEGHEVLGADGCVAHLVLKARAEKEGHLSLQLGSGSGEAGAPGTWGGGGRRCAALKL